MKVYIGPPSGTFNKDGGKVTDKPSRTKTLTVILYQVHQTTINQLSLNTVVYPAASPLTSTVLFNPHFTILSAGITWECTGALDILGAHCISIVYYI